MGKICFARRDKRKVNVRQIVQTTEKAQEVTRGIFHPPRTLYKLIPTPHCVKLLFLSFVTTNEQFFLFSFEL